MNWLSHVLGSHLDNSTKQRTPEVKYINSGIIFVVGNRIIKIFWQSWIILYESYYQSVIMNKDIQPTLYFRKRGYLILAKQLVTQSHVI